MIAAPETLRAQKIRHLIGTAGQCLERELGVAVAAGIDDPQRRAILAGWIARKLRVEPVQRPVERRRIRPAESFYGSIVVGAMPKQEGAGFLEGRHVKLKGLTTFIPVILRRELLRASKDGP